MKYALFTIIVLSPLFCDAQSLTDTSFLISARKNAVKLYENHIRGNSGFFTGSEYKAPRRTNDDHPYYKSIDGFESTIVVDDQKYENVWLLYDLTSDNVITEHFYSGSEIALVKAKVQRFVMDGDEFVNIQGESLLPGLPGPGYYHVRYDGTTRVLTRYTALMEDKVEGNKLEIYFSRRTRHYMLKEGVYQKIASRRDVLTVMSDRKSDVKNFLREEKLKIGKKNPSAYGEVARFYDSIKTLK